MRGEEGSQLQALAGEVDCGWGKRMALSVLVCPVFLGNDEMPASSSSAVVQDVLLCSPEALLESEERAGVNGNGWR
jgi:hypothetical protein